jgi:Cu(I)/Ag(I) efflux system membrane fusion protein
MRPGLKDVGNVALADPTGTAELRTEADRANGASIATPAAPLHERSRVGGQQGDIAGTLVRVATYVVVLGVAIGGVYYATRSRGATAAPAAGHNHSGAAPGAAVGRSVMLTPSEAQRIGVTYATATVGPFGQEVRTVAQVTFDETTVKTIAPKIDGWVEQLVVDATGQYVARGQPLFTIYSPMLVSAQEELLLAKQLQVDVAGASADARASASDLLISARRRLAYWDIPESEIAEIERSGAVRKTLTIRAPAGGYVLEKNVLAGQKIMGGEALYKVADLSTVWLEGEVFEQDLASVRVGQTVHADLEALPGEQRTGRIAYIYPTLSPDTRTVRVRVVVTNADLRLKPGMYATIRIAGTERANVLTVPRSAVLSTGERSIVFVREAGGQLTPREVTIGASSDDRIEVLRGLAAGQTVVASATFLIDAESNLGTALGGMGNMPGMDVTTPPKAVPKGKE